MQKPSLPFTRDLVLVGGGHTHALMLRKWGMAPLPGARVTLINPGPTAPYSGMLPGFVAGHYDRADLDIDLIRLARFAGARVVMGAAHRIDRNARQIHVAGRPPIGYDVASIDVGITSDMPDMPGFAEHAVPAKPLGTFAARWQSFVAGQGAAHIAVIGSGVAGAELAMAMAHALRDAGRPAQVNLIEARTALTALRPSTRSRVLAGLADQGVTLREGAKITHLTDSTVHLADGTEIAADFITGAAGALPYDWLATTGLKMHEGFVTVDAQLQSSDPSIFATGDCAHMAFDPRPKAGVYAVRQAPVLLHNLRAALSGGAMRRYRPQNDYLKLISLGARRACGDRFGIPLYGGWVWRWKDRIDTAFMDKFRQYPNMPLPPLPSPRAEGGAALSTPMCGGCGAKVGRDVLQHALSALPPSERADIEHLPGDDAALLHMGDIRQVISTDHLRAFSDDPVVMTRVAAQHALNDIWAMGAAPQAATATIILPRMSDALAERSLAEILDTAHSTLTEVGAALVGGHTSMGDEMTIGFTITGLLQGSARTLAGARVGDRLILTRPLGSGVILAGGMRGLASGPVVMAALDRMSRSNATASRILADAHAMTDVTGFGLAGHLLNLCEASRCGAHLIRAAIPTIPGALPLAEAGVRSTLFEQNRAGLPGWCKDPLADLLVDPQTSGGLLAAVSPEQADALCAALIAAGEEAAIIGEITADVVQITLD